MDWAHRFVKEVIFIEFFLVILIILATYILKVISFYRNKKNKILKFEVTQYFADVITREKHFDSKNFPIKWQKFDVIIPILHEFRRLVDDAMWHTYRTELSKTILLPLARQASGSSNWVLRFYAAEFFGLIFEKEDEKYIIKLVNDQKSLVRINGLSASITFGSEKAINDIITLMGKESWLTQSIYLQAFDNVPSETRYYIEKRLLSSHDLSIRATCYNILIKYPPEPIFWDITDDILSEQINLKLAATKFVTHVDRKIATPFLIKLLQDPNWQARTVALHCLSQLNATETLPFIAACLSDSNEWVALVAGQVLKNLGDLGERILRSKIVQEEDDRAQHIAQHILDTL